jgi:hypothetical protein
MLSTFLNNKVIFIRQVKFAIIYILVLSTLSFESAIYGYIFDSF